MLNPTFRTQFKTRDIVIEFYLHSCSPLPSRCLSWVNDDILCPGVRLARHCPWSTWWSPCCIRYTIPIATAVVVIDMSQAGPGKHQVEEHQEEAGQEHLHHRQERLLDLLLLLPGAHFELSSHLLKCDYCPQPYDSLLNCLTFVTSQPWPRLQCLSSILPAVCSVSYLAHIHNMSYASI